MMFGMAPPASPSAGQQECCQVAYLESSSVSYTQLYSITNPTEDGDSAMNACSPKETHLTFSHVMHLFGYSSASVCGADSLSVTLLLK